MKRIRKPSHPGVTFKTLVLDELQLSVTDAAKMLGVSRKALSEVINEKSSLSPEMAKRWAKFTETSVASWYNMQVTLNIWEVENDTIANDIQAFSAVG